MLVEMSLRGGSKDDEAMEGRRGREQRREVMERVSAGALMLLVLLLR
jgi:hypothetical protein